MYGSGMLEIAANSLLKQCGRLSLNSNLLKQLGEAQDKVGRACAPVCPTLLRH